MEHLLRKLHWHPSAFGILYFAYFLYALHLFLVSYISSSFLRSVVDESLVGALFVVGAALSITTLLALAKLLRRLGNYRALALFTTLEIMALLGLASTGAPSLVVLLFVAHFALFPLVLFCLDIFLESSVCDEAKTGSTRGLALTTMSVALIVAPLISGFIVGEAEAFSRVYFLSAVLLVPFLGIVAFRFRRFYDPSYQHGNIVEHIKFLTANPNLWHVFSAHFIVRIFFTVMVVYLPIYLSTVIGFSWPQIGLILFVMLSPHALFSTSIGKNADSTKGRPFMLIGGFILMAVALGFVSFMETANILAWMAVLFALRIGAAVTETTTETYFFKMVDGDDSETIGLFRVLRPFAYLIGIASATIVLAAAALEHLFLALGLLMVLGAYFSAAICGASLRATTASVLGK